MEKEIEKELIKDSDELKKALYFSISAFIASILTLLFIALSILFSSLFFVIALVLLILLIIFSIISIVNRRKLGLSEFYEKKARTSTVLVLIALIITILIFIAFMIWGIGDKLYK